MGTIKANKVKTTDYLKHAVVLQVYLGRLSIGALTLGQMSKHPLERLVITLTFV